MSERERAESEPEEKVPNPGLDLPGFFQDVFAQQDHARARAASARATHVIQLALVEKEFRFNETALFASVSSVFFSALIDVDHSFDVASAAVDMAAASAAQTIRVTNCTHQAGVDLCNAAVGRSALANRVLLNIQAIQSIAPLTWSPEENADQISKVRPPTKFSRGKF